MYQTVNNTYVTSKFVNICTYFQDGDESDDELSTVAVIAITFACTFIITALITYIITSLYYRHQYKLKEKIKVDIDNNDNSTQKGVRKDDITMEANPAYGTVSTIRMTNNPTYDTVTTKMDAIPAYAITNF